jgi:hypothetical protein
MKYKDWGASSVSKGSIFYTWKYFYDILGDQEVFDP